MLKKIWLFSLGYMTLHILLNFLPFLHISWEREFDKILSLAMFLVALHFFYKLKEREYND